MDQKEFKNLKFPWKRKNKIEKELWIEYVSTKIIEDSDYRFTGRFFQGFPIYSYKGKDIYFEICDEWILVRVHFRYRSKPINIISESSEKLLKSHFQHAYLQMTSFINPFPYCQLRVREKKYLELLILCGKRWNLPIEIVCNIISFIRRSEIKKQINWCFIL